MRIPPLVWLGYLILQMLLASMAVAQFQFDDEDEDTRMVRSVLERQNTLLSLNELVAERLDNADIQALLKKSSGTLSQHHRELLTLSGQMGMEGVDSLPAPPYYQKVTARWETLSDEDLVRDYLLVALQCQSFLERSMSSVLRNKDSNPQLQEWILTRIDEVNSSMRDLDHSLYDLP